MTVGFFAGTTVASLVRQVDKIKALQQKLKDNKDYRYAAIKAAQDDIEVIRSL